MIVKNVIAIDIEELALLIQSRLKRRVGELARVLREADATQELADQLDSLATADTPLVTAARKRVRPPTVAQTIAACKRNEPEKAVLLQQFHDLFQRKAVLSSSAQLRDMAGRLGVQLSDGRRSRQNELAILAALSHMSLSKLTEIVAAVSHPADAVSSLQQWHDIITKNRKTVVPHPNSQTNH